MAEAVATNKCNAEVSESTIIGVINKMLGDNWTLLVIFIVLSGVLIALFFFFLGQLKETLKDYYKNQGGAKMIGEKPVDNEIYDEDETDPTVIDRHMDISTGNFYKEVDKQYKDYNFEKGEYIKTTYNLDESDDVVDRRMLFSKYDDYEYSTTT